MRGGKREGAGPKPLPPELKKKMVSIKLPPWLIAWLRTKPEGKSQAVLIEDALKKVHKLKAPSAD